MSHIPAHQAQRAADVDVARQVLLAAWLRLCRAGCLTREEAAQEAEATASAMRQIMEAEARG